MRPVWRRVLPPANVRLGELHRMFQAALGWEDRRFRAFEIGGWHGMQLDEHPETPPRDDVVVQRSGRRASSSRVKYRLKVVSV